MKNLSYKRVPRIISRCLKKNNWTQKDFADALRCSPQYISDMLKGRRAISTDLALRIAGLLGLSSRALLIAQLDDDLEQKDITP